MSSFEVSLVSFADADRGNDTLDRKSVSCHYLLLNNNLIVWSLKKQPVISRSSSEVKYRVVTDALCEVLWFVSLLSELGIKLSSIPIIWCDNKSCFFDRKSNPAPEYGTCRA